MNVSLQPRHAARHAIWPTMALLVGLGVIGLAALAVFRPQQPLATIAIDAAQIAAPAPTRFGVEYGWIDQERPLFLERYRQLGVNLVRVQISQEVFEPVNDNADPSVSVIDFNRVIPLDPTLGHTLTYRDMFTTLGREFPAMHFQINMWLPARWNAASPDGYLGLGGAFPPKNWAEHAEFVHALAAWLVETCGLAPERLSFSFVNEPNLTPFFVGSDADLLLLADVTRRALDAVSPQIRLAGLDEVHGVTLTQALAPRLKPDCCDLWTFHVYEKGAPALTAALRDRVAALRPLGPVWVTEFADTTFGSPDAEMDFSSPEAALSFASALTQLWPSGVTGIVHFRLADSYVSGSALAQALKAATNAGGWAGHGLFADARGSQGHAPFEIFPAFWVFAHFNTQMAGGTALPTRGGAPLLAAAARHTTPSGPRLTVLLVNPSTTTVAAQLDVANLGLTTARLVSGDWLSAAAGTDLGTVGASNGTLRLNVSLPPQSARWLTVAALAAPTATATPTFAAATTTAPGTPPAATRTAAATTTASGTPPAATVTPRPTGLVTLPPHATRTYLPLLGGGR